MKVIATYNSEAKNKNEGKLRFDKKQTIIRNKIEVKKFKYRVKFFYIVRTIGHVMCYNISKERETNPKETSTRNERKKNYV